MTNTSYFPSDYEEFIFTSRYARWIPEDPNKSGILADSYRKHGASAVQYTDDQRRETWPEAVSRTVTWLTEKTGTYNALYTELYDAILNFHVMPSMRLLMTAGPAAERDNTCIYNCAYLTMDSLRSLDELMYILMCGHSPVASR